MPRAPRPHRVTIVIPPSARRRLEARGARADQGRGPTAYTRQLARTVEFFAQAVSQGDPRQTRRMANRHYDLVLDVIDAPDLDPFRVDHLGSYLLELPAFHTHARQRQIDPHRLAAAINGFAFHEKLHLVDAAMARHHGHRPA
jgi:hypothetical protein